MESALAVESALLAESLAALIESEIWTVSLTCSVCCLSLFLLERLSDWEYTEKELISSRMTATDISFSHPEYLAQTRLYIDINKFSSSSFAKY